ncbi:hypothetical protein Tco_0102273, partial [Tanacetum coccineum]
VTYTSISSDSDGPSWGIPLMNASDLPEMDPYDETDRRDIRLEIDVVRGQRTAYETELHEVRQAYLSSEAQNMALLTRLETLKTHISRIEWQR